MKIKREVAVAMFVALGFKTADKWNGERLVQKLEKLQEVVKPDVLAKIEDDSLKTTINKALEAAKNEDGFVILGDEKPAEEVTTVAETKDTTKPTGEGGKGKTKKEKPPKTAKPPKEPKPPKAEKVAGPPGVRYTRSRPYLAGLLIKTKGGLEAGITEAHVKELDEAYGKENPAESMFCLRNAWHSIRGFVSPNNEKDLDPDTAGEGE